MNQKLCENFMIMSDNWDQEAYRDFIILMLHAKADELLEVADGWEREHVRQTIAPD